MGLIPEQNVVFFRFIFRGQLFDLVHIRSLVTLMLEFLLFFPEIGLGFAFKGESINPLWFGFSYRIQIGVEIIQTGQTVMFFAKSGGRALISQIHCTC